jgi:hypothetical protein
VMGEHGGQGKNPSMRLTISGAVLAPPKISPRNSRAPRSKVARDSASALLDQDAVRMPCPSRTRFNSDFAGRLNELKCRPRK